ncbi:hypothetical protein HNQ35_000710 [Cerasibacillus quisquiliarum]|uniref:DUF4190 domain-containing protein n=1 Tax=Cerasibacillus quisquiliarum TaxID=227865 RepID=A0A511UWU1_9BACI|nr:DUF4190 domain-containing protein [Cerasibacillus quisquiliarum]MBB5145518.1 hypothetical protein [Cerasibacillus quisquiliarum]GEN31087.1 hypothetical protein CQU01_13250 [Cerasibacillus quisquiliarum]
MDRKRNNLDDYREETGAEISGDIDSNGDDTNANATLGWIAVVLSAISFFWLPILMGASGIIVGIFARTRNAEVLGNIAIIAGAVSIILSLFINPFT